LVKDLLPFLRARGYPERPGDYVAKAVRTLQPRARTLVEMADALRFFLVDRVEPDPEAARKFLTRAMEQPFEKLISALDQLETFTEEGLERVFQQVVTELGIKLGKIAQPVRVALTGTTVSPGLFEIIDVLGKETVLERLKSSLDLIRKTS
ncbi:MAG TPA: glutamate--tRNA ligase, partial [Syntrophobacteraceae bacterium]|nr:glutamate--tRNA ligase [Syntrophobacteraceae bacterium]